MELTQPPLKCGFNWLYFLGLGISKSLALQLKNVSVQSINAIVCCHHYCFHHKAWMNTDWINWNKLVDIKNSQVYLNLHDGFSQHHYTKKKKKKKKAFLNQIDCQISELQSSPCRVRNTLRIDPETILTIPIRPQINPMTGNLLLWVAGISCKSIERALL